MPEEVGPRTTNVVGGRVKDARLAHRRPGYPLVGLRARRARLRFARQGEGSATQGGSKEGQDGKQQEKVSGRGRRSGGRVKDGWARCPCGPGRSGTAGSP